MAILWGAAFFIGNLPLTRASRKFTMAGTFPEACRNLEEYAARPVKDREVIMTAIIHDGQGKTGKVCRRFLYFTRS